MNDEAAWENGIITAKSNYTSRDIWSGKIPRYVSDLYPLSPAEVTVFACSVTMSPVNSITFSF